MAEQENTAQSIQSISAGESDTLILDLTLIPTDEIALYDRQIRLWGVSAQQK